MLFLWFIIHIQSDSPAPSNLTATYKSPSTVLLEWMFSDPFVGDTMYTVYYQSGGVSYNTSFTLTEDQRSYLMMDLPLEVITNIFIVAVTKINRGNSLPSPLVGPASLGRLHNYFSYCVNIITWPCSMTLTVEISVELVGSGIREVGSVYTLTCTVALSHRASDSSVSILWEGPSTHQQTVDTTDSRQVTRQLSLDPLSLADGGDHTCTASYTTDGETTVTRSDTEIVTPISKSSPVLTSLYSYSCTSICGAQNK